MADNVPITAGSGTIIGTDEVTDGTLGTVQIQYMKLMDGTLNSTNKLIVNSSGEVYTYQANGSNIVLGSTTDAAVLGDVNGSVSAKLRGLSKIFNDVWDTGDHALETSFSNTETNAAMSTTWTSATSLNAVLVGNTVGFGNVGLSVVISGSISIGVLSFEISPDGTTWFPLGVIATPGGSTSEITTYSLTSGSGSWQMFVGGFYQVRIRLSTAITGAGSATVWVRPSVIASELAQTVYQPTGSNLHVQVDSTVQLGSGSATIGNVNMTYAAAGYMHLTDGTSGGIVAVKAASTAAIATDPALVVAISPNNTIPVSGTFYQATQPVSGTFWQATQPVSGTFYQATQPVSIATAPVLVAGAALIGKVGIDQTTAGTTNAISLAQIGATTVVNGGVAGTLAVGGMTAVNATSTGNPVYSGGIALVAANPTKATNGQRTGVATDAAGRVITVPNHERTMTGVQQTTITSSTGETTIVTAVASTFIDLTHLSITNSSASATLVTLKDSTAGTTRGIWSISAGGGIVLTFNTPLAQATVNNNWTITCGTSVASVYVVAQYVKNT